MNEEVHILKDKYNTRLGDVYNTLAGDIYKHITSFDNWRNIDSLKSLAQWESSSVQRIAEFKTSEIEESYSWLRKNILKVVTKFKPYKKTDLPMKNILRAVASGDFLTFRELLK